MKTSILKKHPETGRIYLRESVLVSFFFSPPIHEAVDGLRDAFELFLEAVPPDALTWSSVGANSEEWKSVGKQTRMRCLNQLKKEAAKARKLTAFQLTDGQVGGDAPGYGISVVGDPGDPQWPDEIGLIEMSFPMEVLDAGTANTFMGFCKQVARLVRYVSGYASPALQWALQGRGQAAAESRGIALRHPGYDVHMNELTRTRLGVRVRGARWLTFLGEELVGALGGKSLLRGALSSSIGIEAAGAGLMIRAGELPEIGDVNQQIDVPLLREVARVLKPVTFFQDPVLRSNFANFDEDFLERWEHRLLD